ncbi:MAG: homoserine kinase, partial [Nitrospinota bacterium]
MPPLTVQVPATVTNLGPGFDVLGVALTLYNQVELEELPWGLSIQVEGEGEKELPQDETNIAYQAVREAYRRAGRELPGLWMKQRNHIPLARGLGSSAAARVAGLVGANEMMGRPLSEEDLLAMAAAMEGHPDNVLPALKGGLCVAALAEGGQVRYAQAPLSARFQFVLAIPGFSVETERARAVLPREVPLAASVFNLQRLGLLLGALGEGR